MFSFPRPGLTRKDILFLTDKGGGILVWPGALAPQFPDAGIVFPDDPTRLEIEGAHCGKGLSMLNFHRLNELDRNRLLKKSKHFCMIPWVHMHFFPNGSAFPCCMADSSKPIGRYGEQDLAEIWNGEKYRAIRRNMLVDQPSPECSRCYLLEENTQIFTLRKMSNEAFAEHWEKVASTEADGTAGAVNMTYLDIRFSNLCNFRCHSCGPQLSSGWYEDQLALVGGGLDHSKVIRIEPSEKFWSEIEPLLNGVEQCYFAGGEPLLCEEHYRILDFWLDQGKVDPLITYTTNFSQIEFRGRSAFDYWKRFRRVRISASLDASGPRGEYLRKGTQWDRIIENRRRMLRECPDVYFEITPTISAFNVFHFPDFHLDWVTQGLLEVNAIRLNLLSFPPFMGIGILPDDLKRATIEKFRRVKIQLRDMARSMNKPFSQFESDYDSIIDLLEAQLASPPRDVAKLRADFRKRTSTIDRIRGERLSAVFPELGELLG